MTGTARPSRSWPGLRSRSRYDETVKVRLAIAILLAASIAVSTVASAQDTATGGLGRANQAQAQLRVIVLDQTAASIPSAMVRVTPLSGVSIDLVSDERGQAMFSGLAPGVVRLHVEAPGFAPYDASITLRRGNNNQTITLKVAAIIEDVIVTETAGEDDRRGNAFTTTLNEDDIAALPDDPDELQAALEEMTGGAGAVFFVDGFRGGRLPPKSEIRQVRFRRNSFSADNHDAGRMQVEIITRPGLSNWSGNANVGLDRKSVV